MFAWRITTAGFVVAIMLSAASLVGAQGRPPNTPPRAAPSAALAEGTWAGDIFVRSAFRRPFFQVHAPGQTGQFNVISIPIISGGGFCIPHVSGTCVVPTTTMTVELNNHNLPDDAVLVKSERSPVTLNIQSSGSSLTGTFVGESPSGVIEASGVIDGVAVSGNFFLFHIVVNESNPGPCVQGQFHGSGSVMPSTPDKLLVTVSGFNSRCNRETVSATLTRQ